MAEKQELLKRYFGYDTFLEGQEQAVDALLEGRDVLSIMPTGAGKSLCFQLPALLLPGIGLVISPLISLMKDQVGSLVQAGIPAAYLNSSLSDRQYALALENARRGKYKLIYVAPERLETQVFLSFALATEISMVAVDEAHCVSQWGQDFRPSYLKIPAFVEKLPYRPVVGAFTATATPEVQEDILRQLHLEKPKKLVTGFDRKNLCFEVRHPQNKKEALLKVVAQHPEESGVVYCSTRKAVEEVYSLLDEGGIRATRYHAGLSPEERRSNQDAFAFDHAAVMVATNAFGMGIDKSDVRFVVHYNMPKDLESYYQEAGRAGRDGAAAVCVLLYSGQDIITNQFLIDQGDGGMSQEEQEVLRRKDRERLHTMINYCHTTSCLRQYILHYFGEQAPNICGNCSSCLEPFEEVEITEDAQKILSCIRRTGQHFGVGTITEILCGVESDRVKKWALNRQSTYGLLSGLTQGQVKDRIRCLIEQGYLRQHEEEYYVLTVEPLAKEVLFDGVAVRMKFRKPETKKRKKRSVVEVSQEDGLFQCLRKLRAEVAKSQGVPAYVVFSDKTLQDMCGLRPKTKEEMLEVSGVGSQKLEKYGAQFLQEIARFLAKT